MKNIIKWRSLVAIMLALCAAVILGCGCNILNINRDPLAGWKRVDGPDDPVMMKDCKNFIDQFKPHGQRPSGVEGFYENDAGQYALNVEIFKYHSNASWMYLLIYDKDGKRIKVIKYGYGAYHS